MDSLAPTRPAAAALERPTPRRGRLDAWLDGRRLDDQALAAYLAEFHNQGRARASASTVVAAACFQARLAGDRGRGTDGPGPGPATGGPPAIEAGGKRGRSGRRTSPPSSPPATVRGAAGAASSPTPSPSSAAASTP